MAKMDVKIWHYGRCRADKTGENFTHLQRLSALGACSCSFTSSFPLPLLLPLPSLIHFFGSANNFLLSKFKSNHIILCYAMVSMHCGWKAMKNTHSDTCTARSPINIAIKSLCFGGERQTANTQTMSI